MAKQLNVNLAVTADTSKAKVELQSLQKTLDQLMTATAGKEKFGISAELQKSVSLATQLKAQLEKSTMSNGNLDLSKFNLELQKSNIKIQDYKTALTRLGPAGAQAFQQLASSIMSAEVPLRRSNTLLTNFATTLKNTARWQISSSILHGFMGALQGAYGYAQDLNESLNNIRIVTGQNIDQMAKFADQANRAAKNLSTTTTAYTDAALIYYQQGLKDKEVIDRTDVTVKMANVSRQSAEEVSSQMTAIWNNFADGSKELEYYADVITALGAATASSSDEIAEGLSKFASIADTVGLSYEKATAALATVVAETRQSADVVGTAFKTMFARLQGLSLGETLEDGVDLNKYSNALKTVGVDILDAKGNLKDMDSILDATAEKWDSISEAQKVALAETVAGVRQYSQFMAIMNNYDKILANQDLAAGSSGTLQEQADIYAESWEAAQKRVKAAMQSVYSDIIDDKFFIKILNGIEKIITGVDEFIDAIGGLPSVLTLIGSLMTQVFSKQIASSIQNMINNIHMMSAKGRQEALNLRKDTLNASLDAMQSSSSKQSYETQGSEAAIKAQTVAQQALIENENHLNEQDKLRAQSIIKITQSLGEQAIAAGKVADEAKRASDIEMQNVQRIGVRSGASIEATIELRNAQNDLRKAYQDSITRVTEFDNILGQINPKSTIEITTALEKMREKAADLGGSFPVIFQKIEQSIVDAIDDPEKLAAALDDARVKLELFTTQTPTENLRSALKAVGIEGKELEDTMTSLAQKFQIEAEAAADAGDMNRQAAESAKIGAEEIDKLGSKAGNAAMGITQLSSVFMSLTTAISALKNLGSIWSNEDLSTGEKLFQTLSSLSMIIPLVTSLTQKDALANMSAAAKKILHITATEAETAAEGASVPVKGASAAASWGLVWPILALTAALLAVIGIIWLFVKGLQAIKANTPEGKLEAAKDKAKELKTALDDATNSANELKSAFDSYESIQEKLKNCTKGTQEWYDALTEANSKVLELISNYPELAEYVYTDKDGIMHIKEDAMKNLEHESNKRVIAAQGAYSGAQQEVREAQITVDRKNFANDLSKNMAFTPGGPNGGGSGESIAAMSQLIANNAEKLQGITKKEDLTKAIGDILTTGGFGKELAGEFAEIIQSKGLIQSIDELSASIKANSAAKEAENQLIASNILANEESVQNSKYGQDISKVAGNLYSQEYDKSYNDYMNQFTSNFFEKYAAQNNIDLESAKYKADGSVTYTDEAGEKQTISKEEVAAFLAAADAQDKVVESASNLINKFEELATSGNGLDNAFKDFLTSGNLEDMSKKDLDEISGSSFQDILSQVKESFTPEELQELGYKSAEQFAIAFKQGLANAEDMWSGLTDEEIAAKEAEILKNKLTSAAQEHAAAVDLDAEEIELLTEAFADENDGLDDQHQLLGNVIDDQDKLAEAAADAAVRFKQLNNAVNDIADNYEDYSNILNKVANAETLQDKAMAMSEKSFKNLKKSLADVLGVNQDLLKNDFISNVDPDVLNELAEGGETATKAVQKLRNAFIDAQAAEADLADSQELDDFKSKLADLEDGAVIDINTDPFLMKLIEAKLEAGASATDIEEMLSGMGIDCDVEPFKGAMEELTSSAQNAANATYEAGDAIVGNMSFDAQANDLTVENTDTKEDVGFDETVTATPKVRVNRVLKNKADDATPVITTVWEYDKTITPKRDRQEEKKSSTVTGVKISNAHKSAGGNVSNTSGRAGGHGGGGSCFVADTLISMQNYYKKIKEIKSGDIVLSYNEQTMKNEYSKVLQTMIHKTIEKIYSLFIEDEKLQATGVHRFLITRNNKKEWIQASELKVGDLVLFADGTLHKISKIKTKLRILTVYNFEVSNNHNYYVGKNQILAHNKGGGGGGGGKAATTKAATHKHDVHRYSNEENQIKGLSTIYDRLNTAKDKTFGADRIRMMEKELATLKKLRDASADYLGAIVGSGNVDKVVRAVYSGQNVGSMIASGAFGGTVASDYKSLLSGVSASGKNLEYNYKDDAGNEKLVSEAYSLAGLNSLFGSSLGINLDSYGNVQNKDALLNKIQELYNQEMDSWAAKAEPTAAQENDHNKRLAYLEEFQERLEQYEETAQMIQEQVDQYLEYIYQAQALNAEKIVHELEVNNTLTEHQLEEIQNAIKLLGNKIYRSTEAMNEWFRKNFKERQDAYAQNVDKAKSSVEEAMSKWQLWAEDELNPEGIDSVSALSIIDQAKDQVQAAFDDIFDQISEMEAFFGDTLDYWNDRIQAVTNAMEANADTLDHLQNVLSLLGKATDYKALGVIIKGALDVAKDNYAAAKAKSEASSSLYNQVMREYNSLSGENAEFFYESTVMPAREQMFEDQANMRAALENTLEKVNAWFENELNRIYQESEDRLVGKWGSFDALDSAMERQKNLADEYLTKTNQLYETNTLLRKLSQDIDKTDSSIAKAKLKAFSDEIEAMKEQNQLSKTDLEIAKARYELLQAQIALEEAQNAKSTVRLQRDNEGNYGYVYTADQDKVNDAEQNFADKQNDLYNLVLNQAQDYTEKIIQIYSERNAALRDLQDKWLNGEITSEEEYKTQLVDIVEKYNGLLETSYESYYTAIKWLNEVGAEGQTEAWTNSFSDILYGEEEFSEQILQETDNLVHETDDLMGWLNDERDYYTEEAKVGNKELKDTIDDVTASNKLLTNSLTGPGGLISGMQTATSAAARLTAEFASQYQALLDMAEGYAQVISQMNSYYATIAAYERSDDSGGDDFNLNTDYNAAMQEAVKRGLITSTNDALFKSTNALREKKIAILGESVDYKLKGQEFVDFFSNNINLYKNGGGASTYSSLSDEELKKKLAGLASGGYTGEWGNTGKLALLHEKELVLNKDDTDNILNAVTLIRKISSAIDLRAAASSLSSGLNSPNYDNESGMLEQVVTIHAEFPNVQDRNEIEEAFDNLINRASQYAHRRR